MLLDFLDEFMVVLDEQLRKDELRWGRTWMYRPVEGQEMRIKARFNDYFDQFERAGVPVPWLKVVGNAYIAWVRENHPEVLVNES